MNLNYRYKKGKESSLSYNGIIERIEYTQRRSTIIYVSKDKHDLSYYGIGDKFDIEVGDSVSKKRNSRKILIFRKTNNKWKLNIERSVH